MVLNHVWCIHVGHPPTMLLGLSSALHASMHATHFWPHCRRDVIDPLHAISFPL